MLVRFTLANFMSFKDEAVLSMLPSKVMSHAGHVVKSHKSNGLRVLKSAVIYGANASGKSNLIKAISVAQRMVVHGDSPSKTLPYQPYRLSVNPLLEPCRFEFEIKVGERCYAYGFSFNLKSIVEEWLFEISRTKEQPIFVRKRDGDKSVFAFDGLKFAKSEDKQFLEFVARGTPDNRLFLRECFERNVLQDLAYLESLVAVFGWFKDKLTVLFPNSKYAGLEMDLHSQDMNAASLSALLLELDTGVSDLHLEQVDFMKDAPEIPPEVKQDIIDNLAVREAAMVSGPKGIRYQVRLDEGGEPVAYKLMTVHLNEAGEKVLFEVNQESDGTQRLLDIAPGLVDLMSQDKVYVIDELDRSLHSAITTRLLSQFLALTAGQSSQLIVTTHESNLLDLDLLRRDEIWFVQKNRQGASALYSLEEFKTRFDKDIRKGYLVGRFGGVPVLKSRVSEDAYAARA